MTTRFRALWNEHPGAGNYPCDEDRFPNQCAIRLGAALERNGIHVTERGVRTCRSQYDYGHEPPHVLSAQQLANLLWRNPSLLGPNVTKRRYTSDGGKVAIRGQDLNRRKGVIFMQNGWGNTDHIDLWDGTNSTIQLRGARPQDQGAYKTTFCRAILFWEF